MRKFLSKFEISISLFIVLFFAMIFGFFEYFLAILLMVLLHELAHILTAKCFGIKFLKILITPIGQMASLKNLEFLSKWRKIAIVLAGPMLNIILAFIFNFFTNEKMQLIKNINLSIAFFNLLPIYPLDGGRIYQYILGSKIGALKSSLIIKKISLFFSYFIFLLGFLQLIFISYNISLLCLGFYLIKLNKNEYLNFTFEFYKCLKMKKELQKTDILKIKEILVDKEILNKKIFISLTQDDYTIINITDNGEIKWRLTEEEFIEKIQLNGLSGIVSDLIRKGALFDRKNGI